VNLDDPTCMQNFEVSTQGAYALIWTICRNTVDTW
jgi:hypothetical protein